MSETPKFTPGPWRTSRNAASTDSFYVLTAGEGQMFQLQICARASEANAYLIAAAPELYAALRAALVRLHEMDSAHQKEAERMECGYTGLPEVRLAEAALSKAEGRS